MINSHVERLKELLAEIDSPTAAEFNKITKEFNKFKNKNNPNFKKSQLSFSKTFYLINDSFEDFQRLTKLLSVAPDKSYRSTLNRFCIGLFYEIVTTIRNYDLFGFMWAGFNLTQEELEKIEGYRHTVFHIPDDEHLFAIRANQFLNMEKLIARFLENSFALNRYINFTKKWYGPFLSQEVKEWKVTLEIQNGEMWDFVTKELPSDKLEDLLKKVKPIRKK